ncbi:hypothetical protein SAMN06265222_110195 [Neorhodopirellula lusitana]|uniref:Uncharacterized protein n=1 Tax=Neorhodopirellula lusitana TaxID=445327 RepID=A0ABY1QCU1_9BACT|nr:hypothetical protein SAMN06265222_110195 [Neorhodopirellula lusitana]
MFSDVGRPRRTAPALRSFKRKRIDSAASHSKPVPTEELATKIRGTPLKDLREQQKPKEEAQPHGQTDSTRR